MSRLSCVLWLESEPYAFLHGDCGFTTTIKFSELRTIALRENKRAEENSPALLANHCCVQVFVTILSKLTSVKLSGIRSVWRISGEWKITLRHVKAGLLVLVSFRIMVKFKHQITEQERLQTHRVSTKVVKTLVVFCSLYFLGKGSRDELQSNSPVTFYCFLAMTVLKFYTPLITTPCHLQHETNYSRIN